MSRNPESAPVTVSVIVPAHNAALTIGEQLAALSAQTYGAPYEVIVVANRCSDDTVAVAHSYRERFGNLLVVVANQKASATYARNMGVESAAGRLLLFCDADDVVDGAWIEHRVAALRSADLVGGRLVPMSGSTNWATRILSVALVDGLPRVSPDLHYVVSASLGCRREVVEAIGGWDERFGAASDDCAFSIAAQRAGFRLGYAPDARCSYRLRTSFRDVVAQQRRYGRGLSDLTRYVRPYTYMGGAAELTVQSVSALKEFLRIRQLDDLRVFLAHIAYRLAYLGGLISWRRTRPHDDLLPRGWNTDYLVTLLGKRLDPMRRLGRYRAAAERMPWHQPLVDFTFPLDTPIVGGLGAVGPGSVAHLYASYRETTEPVTLTIVSMLLTPGGRFLDIGANLGLYSMVATRVTGSGGAVTAIEPSPKSAAALRKNLACHAVAGCHTSIHQVAAGSQRGRLTIVRSLVSLVDGVANSPYRTGATRTIQVDMTPIDDFDLGPLDLVKIDVEGHEPEVLDGMALTLQRSPDACLVIEVNPACLSAAGHRLDDLLDHHALAGRTLWVIDDRLDASDPNAVRPIIDVRGSVGLLGPEDRWYANLIAVPQSRVADFERVVANTAGEAIRQSGQHSGARQSISHREP